MTVEQPASPAQVAELLRDSQQQNHTVEIAGARTKTRMGGPIADTARRIETTKLNRILAYDPRDLTISVEAGILYKDFIAALAEKKQVLPIEPPFADTATIGGILATHSTGHRRRLFGTVRDLVIGMKFATLEGKIVQSGGMVVKNVAGLDFAKLMTGSFGTLACITEVNFKLMPSFAGARSFALQCEKPADLTAKRQAILASILQPSSIDVLNPAAAARLGLAPHWSLIIEALGSDSVLDRYQRELTGFEVIPNDIWPRIREFTPAWLSEHAEGSVARLSTPLTDIEAAMQTPNPALARGGNGVVYVYSPTVTDLPDGVKGVIEFSPHARPSQQRLWPHPGEDFFLMEKIKRLFDPTSLLNPGRLYGRI